MAVKVTGGIFPPISRIESGLYSLDYALHSVNGVLGLPLRSIYEIYGRPGVGKSSLCYYLAGCTANAINKESRVDLCDLEILDPDYVVGSFEHTGFNGTLNFISNKGKKKERRLHEFMVQELVDNLTLDEVSCGVLDSVGAIVPVSEADGDFGEANMGRRAKLMAQVSRRAIRNLRDIETPKALYIVNHVNAVIGGRGHVTPGGDSIKFLGAIRMMIYQKEVIEDSKKNVIAIVSEGQVEKLRYGAKGRKFTFVTIPGYGVSKEMTAVMDCVELKLATRKTTVKIGNDSVGYLAKLIESAQGGYSKTFDPFFDVLEKYKANKHNLVEPEETESYDESEEADIHEADEDTFED